MAVKVITKTHTFGATGQSYLYTILGRDQNTWIESLAIRSARNNTDDIFWKDEDGDSGGYIGPEEAVTMDFGAGQTLLRRLSLTSTPGHIVYITVGMNTNNADMV